jgi:hypothetical protein
MAEPLPTRKDIVNSIDAQTKTIDSISRRLSEIETLIDKQDSKNQSVITGVLIASVFIVLTVAVQVIISNKTDKQFYSHLENSISDQNLKVQDLNNKVDNIKIRNPYLK